MKKNLSIIITCIGVIIAGVVGYYQIFYNPKVKLEIKKVNEVLLTKPLNIDGLSASYYYHDTIEVKSLWQSTFLIKNIGSKSILGDGFQARNIRKDVLPISFNKDCQILSVAMTDCNNEASFRTNGLYVSQWKPNEYVELTVIGEGEQPPALRISDREIIDSEISYSEYSPSTEVGRRKIIDNLPSGLANILKGAVVTIILGLTIYSIMAFCKQLKDIKEIWLKIFATILWFILVALFAVPLLWMF